MSEDRVVSEDLFRTQLQVVEKLASAVMDNATATKGIADTQAQQGRLLERLDDRNEEGRKVAVDDLKEHITNAIGSVEKHVTTEVARVGDSLANKLEFYNKPQFWLAIIILAISGFAGAVMKAIPFMKS